MTKSPRPSPSVFAYCKQTSTGTNTWGGNGAIITGFHPLNNIPYLCLFQLLHLRQILVVKSEIEQTRCVSTHCSLSPFVQRREMAHPVTTKDLLYPIPDMAVPLFHPACDTANIDIVSWSQLMVGPPAVAPLTMEVWPRMACFWSWSWSWSFVPPCPVACHSWLGSAFWGDAPASNTSATTLPPEPVPDAYSIKLQLSGKLSRNGWCRLIL